MNKQYKQLLTILGLFILIPFTSFAGHGENSTQPVNTVIGKTLRVTHVDFKGLDLPATTQFEIEFTDNENCFILINGQKHEGQWRYNDRTNTIDVKDSFFGSIKQFTIEGSGSSVSIMQRVNEEEMHRMITAALR